ncbi:hypothetical protein JH06_4200 [Blastocystis sp. subtype 4]|uniref:hypothetical protein n=1 Tax=Blastocystis sp. subtype 4 TaxID=944170 RepID=UPI00071221CB|nr:hypothetical protein JH06_4200 [Blastocystis sp. subtype 4]KNB42212.1 hypothetical protein JH06_4200 [Blastocystis sp. subtype 4]|eukprot:XP_014525655.1 hypothetical protein JH06_4200 [Blastocystis sp. subtype 4]
MQTDSGFSSFFYAIPPFTRTYLVILLLTGFGGNFGLFDPFSLVFVRNLVLKHFEIWRLVSNFFYIGGPSMNFVFNLMFIFELNPLSCTRGAAGDAADFIFCVLWGAFLNIIVAFIIPNYLLSMPLLQYCIYLWSKQNPNTPRSFWGISIKGFYVPFVLIAFSLLMGAPITDNVIGIITGHIFYYFSQVCEKTKNLPLFVTPNSLRRMLGLPPAGINKKDDDVYKRKWGVGSGHRLGSEM